MYSQLSLSRSQLSRITAYIEEKIWSWFDIGIKNQVTNYCGKEEKLLLGSNFFHLPQYFQYIFLTKGVRLHIHLWNLVVRIVFFLNTTILICRSTDISKCSRGSLRFRDNESRLYIYYPMQTQTSHTGLCSKCQVTVLNMNIRKEILNLEKSN